MGYVGINGIARKLKAAYIGVNGVARKIVKGYVGVDGVARLIWEAAAKVIGDSGIAIATETRISHAAFRAGNYAVFWAGTAYTVSNSSGSVGSYEAIDADTLTLSKFTPNNDARGSGSAAVDLNNYGIVYGGYGGYSSNYMSSGSAYDQNLVRHSIAALTSAVQYLMAGKTADYAIFGGGAKASATSNWAATAVQAYNTVLVKVAAPALAVGQQKAGVMQFGNYVIFAGGEEYNSSSTIRVNYYSRRVVAYSNELIRYLPSDIPGGGTRERLQTAGSTDDYGILFGDEGTVFAFDKNLTAIALSSLDMNGLTTRYNMVSGSLNNCALAIGGGNSSTYLDFADVYDNTLTKLPPLSLGYTYSGGNSCTVGDKLFLNSGTVNGATGTTRILTIQ